MDYNKFISSRLKEIEPSGIRKFFDIVKAYPDAISLGVGEPDFSTPIESSRCAVRAIKNGTTHYTSNFGLFELRKLISLYQQRFGVYYNPHNEIIVTIGASEAIDLAIRTIVDFGDQVLIPSPSYVSYVPLVKLAGGVGVPIPCLEENTFKLKATDIENAITNKTKLLILPYPNNPTGAILEENDLIEVAKICKKKDILVLSDEIYGELTYTEKGHTSIASVDGMSERTIVINGFSKAFAMTGWRLGYVLAPKDICSEMYKIHQYSIMCAPTISQYAGISCLREGFNNDFLGVREVRRQYDFRKQFVYNTLIELGFDCFLPQGAFYLFPSVKRFGMTGDEFANKLFESKKVAVIPGSAFGDDGKYNVRISYACSIKNLRMGLNRIKEFIDEFAK